MQTNIMLSLSQSDIAKLKDVFEEAINSARIRNKIKCPCSHCLYFQAMNQDRFRVQPDDAIEVFQKLYQSVYLQVSEQKHYSYDKH